MARHLMLRLQAPLLSFGGEVIDNLGVIRDFPALSMLTGLLANALGWDRADAERHDRLQARLRMGSRLDCEGRRLTDFQTAQLGAKDVGWTTWGRPEGRAGGTATYDSPHLRYRDFHADMSTLVALRLEPVDDSPTLTDLALALDKPCRPLFIGRKPCVPSGRMVEGFLEATHVLAALQSWPVPSAIQTLRAQWPDGEGELPDDRLMDICDERRWRTGLHGGWRPVREGVVVRSGDEA